ncbi:MAG TPA: alpha/beta hydrolase [Limnochorda sp.]
MRVSVHGVHLEVAQWGQGPAVMALHGAPGLLDHTYLRRALEPLGLPVRWILWDQRGSGRSDEGPPEGLTHRQMVADWAGLREALGLGPAILLGHSYGGFFALEAALRHPDQVTALILCTTAPSHRFFDGFLESVSRFVPQDAWRRLTDPALTGPQPSLIRELAAAFGALLFARENVALAERLLAGTVAHPAVARRLARETRASYDLEPLLGQIRCPTLVVGGLHDRVTAPRWSEVMARAIPGAELVLFPSSGHLPMVEEAALFARTVEAFLRRHRLLGS